MNKKPGYLKEVEKALGTLVERHTLGQYSLAVDTLVIHLPELIQDYKNLLRDKDDALAS